MYSYGYNPIDYPIGIKTGIIDAKSENEVRRKYEKDAAGHVNVTRITAADVKEMMDKIKIQDTVIKKMKALYKTPEFKYLLEE